MREIEKIEANDRIHSDKLSNHDGKQFMNCPALFEVHDHGVSRFASQVLLENSCEVCQVIEIFDVNVRHGRAAERWSGAFI